MIPWFSIAFMIESQTGRSLATFYQVFHIPLQLDLDLKYGHQHTFRPILWTAFVQLAKNCLQE
jgi:hypothetical protein